MRLHLEKEGMSQKCYTGVNSWSWWIKRLPTWSHGSDGQPSSRYHLPTGSLCPNKIDLLSNFNQSHIGWDPKNPTPAVSAAKGSTLVRGEPSWWSWIRWGNVMLDVALESRMLLLEEVKAVVVMEVEGEKVHLGMKLYSQSKQRTSYPVTVKMFSATTG